MDLVLNLAPVDDSFGPNSRRAHQATKNGGRWTDRVKARRVAKRKDDRLNPPTSPTTPKTTGEESSAPSRSERPAKRPRVNSAPAPSTAVSVPPTTAPAPSHSSKSAPSQIVSSLFTYNPSIPTPAPTKSRSLAGPSNAPLKDSATFPALGLDNLLVAHLQKKMGIKAPTAIQRATLSAILPALSSTDDERDARDIFIQSQTGSGKTLAFLLPIIQDLLPLSTLSFIDRSIGTLAIIIVPTRELAKQISDVLEAVLSMRLRAADDDDDEDGAGGPRLTRWLVSGLLTGGATRTHEKARLRKGLPILVSTPGRLLDHLQNTESFNVGKCRWLVLDEADRLMELGFEETITGIIKSLDGRRNLAAHAAADGLGTDVGGWDWSIRRRTILCSATIRDDLEKLAGTTLRDPIHIKGSDVAPVESDAVPGAAPAPLTSSSVKDALAQAPADSTKFTPPAQLSQKYVVVPLKLRLVSLIAMLRSIISNSGSKSTKMIVFLSCTDSVDFHWKLLGGVQMGGYGSEEAEDPLNAVKLHQFDDSDSDSESGSDVEPAVKDAKGKGKAKAVDVEPVEMKSALIPNTSLYRLHGSLPLATRMASLKGFTSSPSAKQKSSSSATSSEDTSSILLCTSVASRGLDLPLVRAVIQYDLPTENGAAEYVHRVGRTARAGKGGEAWSFVGPSESEWVGWIEGSMSEGGASSKPVKLDAVGVQDLLQKGFGGDGNDHEDRATQVQLAFEQWVLRDRNHSELARKAFQSHMRAYATHPSSEKHIFHVRNLHTGHLAKAFALREAPSSMKSSTSKASRDKAPSAASNKTRSGGGVKKREREAKKEDRREKEDKFAGAHESATERMKEVVRKQGRLTKQGGVLVAGGGVSEFQVAGGYGLESMVLGKKRKL